MNKIEIGVVGAGTMGRGIAQVAATAGHDVYLFDINKEVLDAAQKSHIKIFNRLIEKGRMTSDKMQNIHNHLHYTSSLEDLKDCGFVIEAIIENINIKKQLFSDLEKIIDNDCILATNTSSLSVSAIAADLQNPAQFIGVHFFNPAPLMKLVEIIPALQTGPTITTKTNKLIQSWQKTTVLAKDTPGFIVNRVARPFYGEALRIYEEGIADFATIDWAMKTIGGFRMGPFTLMDYIGNDINYTVTETVFKAFYYDPRYKPAFTQKRYADAGWLGRKTGKGYYNYGEDITNDAPIEDHKKGEYIFYRILMMLINEAADAVFWRVASIEDIDTAMTKGVNYPKGLLKWADEIGIEKCVIALDDLYDNYHEDRYRCSPMLRNMAKAKNRFYK